MSSYNVNQIAAPTSSHRHPVLAFLLSTRLSNLLAGAGLLVAILTLVLSTYSSVVQVVTARWSNLDNALQACIALAGLERSSEHCNEALLAAAHCQAWVT